MDWFLYDNGVRHERVNRFQWKFIYTYGTGGRKINFSYFHPFNRNSYPEVFFWIAVLKDLAKIVEKHLRQSLFCDKFAGNFM